MDSWESDFGGFIESENASFCFSKQIRIEFWIELNFAVFFYQFGATRLPIKEFAESFLVRLGELV